MKKIEMLAAAISFGIVLHCPAANAETSATPTPARGTVTSTATPTPAPAPLPVRKKALPLARISSMQGKVEIKRKGMNRFVPALKKAALFPGDVLRTGKAARAEVAFSTGSRVRLNESSAIRLINSKNLTVLQGRIMTRTKPGIQIHTNQAVTGVRG